MNAAKLSKEEIKFQQRLYRQAGFYLGAIDGIWGPQTDAAETKWEEEVQEIRSLPDGDQIIHDPRTERCISGLLPPVQLLARQILEFLALEIEYDARIISGTRTYPEQTALYNQGRLTAGRIVTYARAGQSNHNFGLAFDLGLFDVNGKYLTTVEPYKRAGKLVMSSDLAQNTSLEWGGNWRGTKADYPHYQLGTNLTMTEIRKRFEAGKPFGV